MRLTILSAAVMALTLWGTNTQAASFNCSSGYTFAEEAICANPELSRADEDLGELIEDVRLTFPEERVDWPLRLKHLQESERSFCLSDDCIRDWMDRTVPIWEDLKAAARVNEGEARLDELLNQADYVSDLLQVRNADFYAKARSVCQSDGRNTGAGCFISALGENVHIGGYLDAACQRAKGAASGLACAVLGNDFGLGVGGRHNKERAEELLRKGCYLESASACLTYGDWWLTEGDTQKAEDAYVKAAVYGSEQGRLTDLQRRPTVLKARIASEPSPAEYDYFDRCSAADRLGDETVKCAQFFKKSQKIRLENVLRQAGFNTTDSDKLIRAATKRYNTIFSLVSGGEFGSPSEKASAAILAQESVVSVTRYLSLLAAGESNTLVDMLVSRCGMNCQTPELAKDYAQRLQELVERRLETDYRDTTEGKERINSVKWFGAVNGELAKVVSDLLRGESAAGLMEALIYSEAITYLPSSE